jgi:hypothetical protein
MVLATRAVAEVFAASDTEPGDSTAQAVGLSAQRDGCFSGYSDRLHKQAQEQYW